MAFALLESNLPGDRDFLFAATVRFNLTLVIKSQTIDVAVLAGDNTDIEIYRNGRWRFL
jgi:hypothetical protein